MIYESEIQKYCSRSEKLSFRTNLPGLKKRCSRATRPSVSGIKIIISSKGLPKGFQIVNTSC